jgi:AcrR family transcriptional regulator
MPRIRAETIGAHKEQTRAEVLDAAESLFGVQGFAATSLGEIADVVGVGRTTLYEYFKNKDDLLVDLVETRVPPVLERIVAALPDDLGPCDRLAHLLEACLASVVESPQFGLIIIRAGRKLPQEKQERMWGALDAVYDEIVRLCEAGIESGDIASYSEPRLLARAVADLFVGGMDELLRWADPKGHLPAVLDVWLPFLRRALSA